VLPPLKIAPIRFPRSVSARLRITASTVAAEGSTTSFIRSITNLAASTIACSVTGSTRTPFVRRLSKLMRPRPVIKPSASVSGSATARCSVPD